MSSLKLADVLIRKLRVDNVLEAEDVAAIERLPITMEALAAQSPIVKEGDRPTRCCLLAEGFAYRSKLTRDGKRQIIALHIPGEIPDLQSLHLRVMDHDLTAATKCRVGFITHDALRALNRSRPSVAEALWRETLIDAALFRESIVNVGRRDASQALAHFMLELATRLQAIGLGTLDKFAMPLNQIELGDALGLSPVHVNRVLKVLREDQILEFRRDTVTVLNRERLMELADFSPTYLHQNPGL